MVKNTGYFVSEDLALVPSPRMLITAFTSSSRGSTVLVRPLQSPGGQVHRQTCRQDTHTNKIRKQIDLSREGCLMVKVSLNLVLYTITSIPRSKIRLELVELGRIKFRHT